MNLTNAMNIYSLRRPNDQMKEKKQRKKKPHAQIPNYTRKKMCEKIWLYFEIRQKTESVCSQGLHGSKQNPALSDSFLQVFEWFCVCFFFVPVLS